jgi:hypothetical protein
MLSKNVFLVKRGHHARIGLGITAVITALAALACVPTVDPESGADIKAKPAYDTYITMNIEDGGTARAENALGPSRSLTEMQSQQQINYYELIVWQMANFRDNRAPQIADGWLVSDRKRRGQGNLVVPVMKGKKYDVLLLEGHYKNDAEIVLVRASFGRSDEIHAGNNTVSLTREKIRTAERNASGQTPGSPYQINYKRSATPNADTLAGYSVYDIPVQDFLKPSSGIGVSGAPEISITVRGSEQLKRAKLGLNAAEVDLKDGTKLFNNGNNFFDEVKLYLNNITDPQDLAVTDNGKQADIPADWIDGLDATSLTADDRDNISIQWAVSKDLFPEDDANALLAFDAYYYGFSLDSATAKGNGLTRWVIRNGLDNDKLDRAGRPGGAVLARIGNANGLSSAAAIKGGAAITLAMGAGALKSTIDLSAVHPPLSAPGYIYTPAAKSYTILPGADITVVGSTTDRKFVIGDSQPSSSQKPVTITLENASLGARVPYAFTVSQWARVTLNLVGDNALYGPSNTSVMHVAHNATLEINGRGTGSLAAKNHGGYFTMQKTVKIADAWMYAVKFENLDDANVSNSVLFGDKKKVYGLYTLRQDMKMPDALTVQPNAMLVVPQGVTLDTNGKDITTNGILVQYGKITGGGKIGKIAPNDKLNYLDWTSVAPQILDEVTIVYPLEIPTSKYVHAKNYTTVAKDVSLTIYGGFHCHSMNAPGGIIVNGAVHNYGVMWFSFAGTGDMHFNGAGWYYGTGQVYYNDGGNSAKWHTPTLTGAPATVPPLIKGDAPGIW